ncbi:ATP-dependent RecD-like DNA helicase [Lentibacillus juripiscarius]|uniref:ATP-dependent RecD2 DNA helicase n=2 Tax=Lentibacillus juripiscarius TaxID=257446 RepID=A0ABW5V370_9BACI
MMELTGSITSILYRKDDFLIAVLRTQKEDIKIKGNIHGIEKKEALTVYGSFETHQKYGRQFTVEYWERPLPQTKNQLITFLASPLIKGCGKKQAQEIVSGLGKHALSTIFKQGSSCLLNIKGIGKKRAAKIADSVRSTLEVQEIVSQLLEYGITANMALRVYKEYGSDAVKTLKENPYVLTELNLIGFSKADDIAKRIGIMPTSGYRIEACLKYILHKSCFQAGHMYMAEDQLLDETAQVLNHHAYGEDIISAKELKNGIMNMEEKSIVIENDCVYPSFLYHHEQNLAHQLSRMKRSRDSIAMSSLERQIDKYQKKHGIILVTEQREAIRELLDKQLLILTGGPGTGKTTVIRTMIAIYKQLFSGHTIRLVAPTGKASRKLAEMTGKEASTIHRLIGYQQGEMPEYHQDHKLPCDLLIIDEMSMVDVRLANNLIQAIHKNTKVLFVGDIDQLPSVGPGNVLRDMIQAGVPTIELTEVFRQARESQIIKNAHRVNQGQSIVFDKEKDDFYFLMQQDPKKIAALLVRSASRFLELGYDLSDILVLSPMKKGPVGTEILNEMLREKLNPIDEVKQEWKIGKRFFRLGDKVIQLQNNYEKQIFNGDTGVITGFTQATDDDGNAIDVMKVDYFGKEISYTKTETKELNLGYAITIHKAQGGEAPIVLIPATASHYMMLARNLIYTAMTRAKEKMVVIGTEEALNIAIANNQIAKRNSKLAERLTKNTN